MLLMGCLVASCGPKATDDEDDARDAVEDVADTAIDNGGEEVLGDGAGEPEDTRLDAEGTAQEVDTAGPAEDAGNTGPDGAASDAADGVGGDDGYVAPAGEQTLPFISTPRELALVDHLYRYRLRVGALGTPSYELLAGPAGMVVADGEALEWIPSPDNATTTVVVRATLDDRVGVQSFELQVSDSDQLAQAVVGPGGGALGVFGGGFAGASVTVPAGSLAANHLVQLSSIDPPPVPAALDPDKGIAAVLLEPSGTVFAHPATVTVPVDATMLSGDEPLHLFALQEAVGCWADMPIASVDADSGLLAFEAAHFTVFVVGTLAHELAVSLLDTSADDGCDAGLVGSTWLQSGLAEVAPGAVSTLPADLSAGQASVADVVLDPDFAGSLRSLWVAHLVAPTAPPTNLSTALLSATLVVPGDGKPSWTVVSTSSGDVLAVWEHVDLAAAWDDQVEPLLRGEGIAFRFGAASAFPEVGFRVRQYLRYEPGDGSTLPWHPMDQGQLLAEAGLVDIEPPAAADSIDGDCDGVVDAVDPIPAGDEPLVSAKPGAPVHTFQGEEVLLSCTVVSGDIDEPLSWASDAPDDALDVAGDTAVLTVGSAGLRTVTCSAPWAGGVVSRTFSVWAQSAEANAANAPPKCHVTVDETVLDVGQIIAVSALVSDTDDDPNLLPVTWGLVEGGELVASDLFGAAGEFATTFGPGEPGASYEIACQTTDGGSVSEVEPVAVSVLSAEIAGSAPPQDGLLLPPLASVVAGQTITFKATANHAEPLEFTWEPADLFSGLKVDGAKGEATFTGVEAGAVKVSVTISTATAIDDLVLSGSVVVKAAEAVTDADGDGFDPSGDPADCDDTRAHVHPGAKEVCGNTVDEDCDGVIEAACGSPLTGDTDFDGVPDALDNCPSVANPSQANANPDDELEIVGDACAIPCAESCAGLSDKCSSGFCDESKGACVLVALPLDCDDGDPCVDFGCDPGTGDCTQQPTCGDHGDCVDAGDGNHVCLCDAGYESNSGGACEDVDECADGDDDCGPNSTCQNAEPGFDCVCDSGFEPVDQPDVDCLAVQGSVCTEDTECSGGACADGVCCESECAGSCQACDAGGKCVPAPDGTECADETGCATGNVCQSGICEATEAVCGADGDCVGGKLDPGEDCDDGNDDPADGCTNECKHGEVLAALAADVGPSVAAHPDGAFALAWIADDRVWFRTYGPDGVAEGEAEKLDPETVVLGEGDPVIAPLAYDVGGQRSYVVAWLQVTAAEGPQLVARHIGHDGTTLHDKFVVAAADDEPASPAVDTAYGLGYVIVWRAAPQSSKLRGRIVALEEGVQLYDSELLAEDDVVDRPAVAVSAAGSVAVAWESSASGVKLRRFEAGFDGEFANSPFVVADDGSRPAVSVDVDGDIVVSWVGPSGTETRALEFSDAPPALGAVQLGLGTVTPDEGPAVAGLSDGHALVVRADSELRVCRLSADAGATSDPFVPGTASLGVRVKPDVAATADGSVIVAWLALDALVPGESALMFQRFGPDDSPLPIGSAPGQLADGAACFADEGCEGGFCVDGVCSSIAPPADSDDDGVPDDEDCAPTNGDIHPGATYLCGADADCDLELVDPDESCDAEYGTQLGCSTACEPGESPVTPDTGTIQNSPAVGVASDGSVAVVWIDGDSQIWAHEYQPDGMTSSSPILLTAQLVESVPPAVSMGPDGTYTAAWVELVGGFRRVQVAQRVHGDLGPAAAVTIAPGAGSDHAEPAVARLVDGRSVVVFEWHEFGAADVWAVLIDTDGSVIDVPFEIPETVDDFQLSPDVAPLPDGGFIVTWASDGQIDGNGYDVMARRFDAAGDPVGGEERVPTTEIGDQLNPSVATLPNGDMVFAWTDGPTADVRGRATSLFGPLNVEDILVSGSPAGIQKDVDLVARADGTVLAAFGTDLEAGFGQDVEVSTLEVGPDGMVVSVDASNITVNTLDAGEQRSPSIDAGAGHLMVVAFESEDAEGDIDVLVSRLTLQGSVLEAGVTVPLPQPGEPCSVGADCESLFCAGSRCCESFCSGPCARCDEAGACDTSCLIEGVIDVTETSGQGFPDVVTGPDGSSLVLWSEHTGGQSLIRSRGIAPDGTPLGAAETVADFAGPADFVRAVADQVADPDGGGPIPDFMVVYDKGDGSLFGRRVLDASIVGSGAEFPISSTAGPSPEPDIATMDSNGWVTAWVEDDGLRVRRYDRSDQPLEDAFLASNVGDAADAPALASDYHDLFAVAWVDTTLGRIQVRAYDWLAGAWITGSPFEVGGDGITEQEPAIAQVGEEDFAVAWVEGSQATRSVYLRVFNPNGEPLDDKLLVHPGQAGDHSMWPSISATHDDRLVVAWLRPEAAENSGAWMARVADDFSTLLTPSPVLLLGLDTIASTHSALDVSGNDTAFFTFAADPDGEAPIDTSPLLLRVKTDNSLLPVGAAPLQASDGEACDDGEQCASGFCVGGTCCDSECGVCGSCATGACDPDANDGQACFLECGAQGTCSGSTCGGIPPECGLDADCDEDPKDVGEECDDGNAVNFDGCHPTTCTPTELRVNTQTTGGQFEPSLALRSDGKVAVAWQNQQDDAIEMRVFDEDMTPTSGTDTGLAGAAGAFSATMPDITYFSGAHAGSLVAAWTETVAATGKHVAVVKMQAGQAPPGATLIPTDLVTPGDRVAVAVRDDGGYAVAFNTDQSKLYMQEFTAAEELAGDPVQISDGSDTVLTVSGASAPGGGFGFAWESAGQDQVVARVYDNQSVPMGGEILLNVDVGTPSLPALAFVDPEHFVAVWMLENGAGGEISLRHFEWSVGSGVWEPGAELQANQEAGSKCRWPDVAVNPNGVIAVSWLRTNDDADRGVYLRFFDDDGFGSTGDFQLSTDPNALSLTRSRVGILPDNTAVVAWADDTAAGDADVFVRRFNPGGSDLLVGEVPQKSPAGAACWESLECTSVSCVGGTCD